MVEAIGGFNPLAYLNQIKGTKSTAISSTPSSPSGNSSSSPAHTTPPVGVSSQVLSILQSVNAASTNSGLLSTLLGGNGSSVSSGVYNTLLYTNSTNQPLKTALTAVRQEKANIVASNSPLHNILNSYHAGINAYNKTLQQNAQAAVQAAKDGDPIVG